MQLGTTNFLVRLSQYNWLRQIKDKGHLRFTPLARYRASELKDDLERYDEFEGATKVDQPDSVKRLLIKFTDKETRASLGPIPHRLAGPIKWFGPNSFSHVLCFSIHKQAIVLGENTLDLATEGKKLGSSALLIHDIESFVTRVGEFMRSQNVAFECSPVKYVASDYEGEYSAFMKPARLEYQREYRLAIRLDSVNIEEFIVPRLGETMEVFKDHKIKFTADKAIE